MTRKFCSCRHYEETPAPRHSEPRALPPFAQAEGRLLPVHAQAFGKASRASFIRCSNSEGRLEATFFVRMNVLKKGCCAVNLLCLRLGRPESSPHLLHGTMQTTAKPITAEEF
jgi:hypothetical protein